MPKDDRLKRIFKFLPLGGFLILLGIIGFSPGEGWGAPCLFRALTGLPCPGCGMTHAWRALLHGDWLASWRFHPLGIPAFLLSWTAVLSPWIKMPPNYRARLYPSRQSFNISDKLNKRGAKAS